MTPEAYRILRERDRAFADLYHVLPVAEPGEGENLHIQVSVMRRLEERHRCKFDLAVLPAALDLQRRYVRGVAFPGKAAAFLGRLAVKYAGKAVTRAHVLEEFHARSGLAVSFLDQRTKLDRQEVCDALSAQVVGQLEAVDAAADVVSLAKARLNDPGRPLASFLFLGPTGVGKTQAAKALAAYLFGDADRLVRFDMNEYVEPGSAARLVGTFANPEGFLTSAVSRRPFAVVLLDEIEKAHPDVFDLLLQVLGEGRLTDALGRLVDFGNTILVLTSNLGVREAESRLGFRAEDGAQRAAYVQAAERFFRPEFFNRLDRVVPFRRLGRDEVRQIARGLIQDVFQREGLLRRKCLLRVEEAALDRVVEVGHDPMLGARALKRAVENHLTRPVADRLAAGLPDTLTVVTLFPGGKLLEVSVEGLEEVPRLPAPAVNLADPPGVLERVEAFLRRTEEEFARLRPTGLLGPRDVGPGRYRYFAVREQADRLSDECRALREQWEEARRAAAGPPSFPLPQGGRNANQRRTAGRRRSWRNLTDKPVLREAALAEDVRAYFQDLAEAALPVGERIEARLTELVQEAALLRTVAEACQGTDPEEVVLFFHPARDGPRNHAGPLAETYRRAFQGLGLEAALWPRPSSPASPEKAPPGAYGVLLKGPHALAVARLEEGTHLVAPAHESLLPLQAVALPVTTTPRDAVAAHLGSRARWLDDLAAARAAVAEDPFRLRPVVRTYQDNGPTVDLRSGLLTKGRPEGEDLRAFVLAALPLPAELAEGGSAVPPSTP
jgi:hypothetical protein